MPDATTEAFQSSRSSISWLSTASQADHNQHLEGGNTHNKGPAASFKSKPAMATTTEVNCSNAESDQVTDLTSFNADPLSGNAMAMAKDGTLCHLRDLPLELQRQTANLLVEVNTNRYQRRRYSSRYATKCLRCHCVNRQLCSPEGAFSGPANHQTACDLCTRLKVPCIIVEIDIRAKSTKSLRLAPLAEGSVDWRDVGRWVNLNES